MNIRIYSSQSMEQSGFRIRNDIIRSIELKVMSEFHNGLVLQINMTGRHLLSDVLVTSKIGKILSDILELLDVEVANGTSLHNIHDIPCRVVLDGDRVLGIGNFLTEKFVYLEELVKQE